MACSIPEPPPLNRGDVVFTIANEFLKISESDAIKRDAMRVLLEKRHNFGVKKYGQPLMTEDGRDTYEDAIQEIGDLYMYASSLKHKSMKGECKESQVESLISYLETSIKMLKLSRDAKTTPVVDLPIVDRLIIESVKSANVMVTNMTSLPVETKSVPDLVQPDVSKTKVIPAEPVEESEEEKLIYKRELEEESNCVSQEIIYSANHKSKRLFVEKLDFLIKMAEYSFSLKEYDYFIYLIGGFISENRDFYTQYPRRLPKVGDRKFTLGKMLGKSTWD